jgi:hypothetical protein
MMKLNCPESRFVLNSEYGFLAKGKPVIHVKGNDNDAFTEFTAQAQRNNIRSNIKVHGLSN